MSVSRYHDTDKTLEETKNKMLACDFMDGAGRAHQPLLKDLEQDHSLGEGKCPNTSEEALQVLTAHEDQHRLNKKRNRLRELQDAESPVSSFGQKIESIEKQVCFKCQMPGHKVHQCKIQERRSNRKQAASQWSWHCTDHRQRWTKILDELIRPGSQEWMPVQKSVLEIHVPSVKLKLKSRHKGRNE